MTWLTIARFAAPYAVFFALGMGLAWQIQGVRLDSAQSDVQKEKQKLTDYRNSQREAEILAAQAAEKRRKETINDYQAKLDALGKDHDAYKRCVAAGKCGARVVRVRDAMPAPGESGLRAPGRTDAASPDAVPAAGAIAAEDGIVSDCARTTLQLNQLQIDIEKQRH